MTLCKWEKGPGPIPAWVAGVVSTLAEGQRVQFEVTMARKDGVMKEPFGVR